ncbi:MAG: hypothetical protein AAF938_23260 [Myxococcota bacterium]
MKDAASAARPRAYWLQALFGALMLLVGACRSGASVRVVAPASVPTSRLSVQTHAPAWRGASRAAADRAVSVGVVGDGFFAELDSLVGEAVRFEGLPIGDFMVYASLGESPAGLGTWPPTARSIERRQLVVATLGDAFLTWNGGAIDALAHHVRSAGVTFEHLSFGEANATSVEWLPGTPAFERATDGGHRADVVVVSLGGADLVQWFGDQFPPRELTPAALGRLANGAREVFGRTVRNVRRVLAEIHRRLPRAATMVVMYPNTVRHMRPFFGQRVVAGEVERMLEAAATSFETSRVRVVRLADVLDGGFAESAVELSDTGIVQTGEALFEVLGGLHVRSAGDQLRRDLAVPPPVDDAVP